MIKNLHVKEVEMCHKNTQKEQMARGVHPANALQTVQIAVASFISFGPSSRPLSKAPSSTAMKPFLGESRGFWTWVQILFFSGIHLVSQYVMGISDCREL